MCTYNDFKMHVHKVIYLPFKRRKREKRHGENETDKCKDRGRWTEAFRGGKMKSRKSKFTILGNDLKFTI